MLSHTTTLRVRYAETDQMGVVYHSNYLIWMEVARTEMIAAHGIRYADLERQGIALVVAELSIRYLAPARYDEDIAITARLQDARSRSLRIEYTIARVNDGAALATGFTALVSVATGTGRPVALPPQIARLFVPRESSPA